MVAPDPTHPDLARWRELARAAAKGREPEQLARRLTAALTAQPLYVDRPDGAPALAAPRGWEARVALPMPADAAVLADLARRRAVAEVSGGPLRIGGAPWPSVPGAVALDVGAAAAEARRAAPDATVLADPIAALAAHGGLGISLESAFDAAMRADARPAPSGVWAAEAGAEAPTALAVALSSAVAWFHAARARDRRPDGAIELRIALRGHVLLDLAAVRAARRLLGGLLAAHGLDARGATVAALLPTSELSSVDPSTNLLRMAVAGFAGAAGGADAVVLPAHDAATAEPGASGAKLAANLHLLLAREAMLGRVADPTAGSFAIEHLTDALARAAWAEVQAIAREGGLVASLRDGALQARIAAAAADRAARVARRSEPILGVSLYPDTAAPAAAPTPPPAPAVAQDRVVAAPPVRPMEGWEALRRRLTAAPVRAWLLPIGPIRQHQARLDFAADLLRAAGFTVEIADETPDPADAAASFGTSGAAIACLCGSDSDYERVVPALAGPLAAAGARAVVVAGRWPEPADAWRAAGVTHVVHLGADVLATCAALAGRATATEVA